MNKGRCVRCSCVKAGRQCVDCWPSRSYPPRCENQAAPNNIGISSSSPGSTSSDTQSARRPEERESRGDPPSSFPTRLCSQITDDNSQNGTARDWNDFFAGGPPKVKILRRIPRASRDLCARKLSTILDDVVASNSVSAWSRLMFFPRRCLRAPERGGCHRNLTHLVNKQITEERDPLAPSSLFHKNRRRDASSDLISLARRVSIKLEEGNINGAVRLATSEESIAEDDDSTISALRAKHPPAHSDTPFPPPAASDLNVALVVSAQDIIKALKSFPKGSAGGPDGLRPHHLQDLTGATAGEGGVLLVQGLTSFVNHVLLNKTPPEISPFFFGAAITALNKKDGGIRPIAVGCTLRRLVAKLACGSVRERLSAYLSPIQLGFGVPHGAEAVVHAARQYLSNLPADCFIMKLDFANAFNSIRRDRMLNCVKELAPEIFPFVFSSYSNMSYLQFANTTILSAEGIQQGDPLGPLLFCLTIHPILDNLKSELTVFYLDDGTIGGAESDLLHDFQSIEKKAEELGLHLNHRKTELIGNVATAKEILSLAPEVIQIRPESATLLGVPIGDALHVDNAILEKVYKLKILSNRLSCLFKQDALLLIRSALAIPKTLYLLRTAPCFSSSALEVFDNELRSMLSSVLNVSLIDSSTWVQATLPVNCGGLGVRRSVQLAPSAFLASAAASSHLIQKVLPTRLSVSSYAPKDAALHFWCQSVDTSPPSPPNDKKQRAWDEPQIAVSFQSLLDVSDSSKMRARLLAASVKESGAWIQAMPISAVGLRMTDDEVQTAAALRLGAPLCHPHKCNLCGRDVDQYATHGLSCQRSAGRHFRHAAINNIIQHSLAAANIPSRLEPSGLARSDGKRPDGITISPWEKGRTLIWDATCVDTFAASYVDMADKSAGSVAAMAEDRKKKIYEALAAFHCFVPIAIETSGVFGPETKCFLTSLSSRIRALTHDDMAYCHLAQRLSVAVQKGNTLSVRGSM